MCTSYKKSKYDKHKALRIKALQMYENGKTVQEISYALSITQELVIKYIKIQNMIIYYCNQDYNNFDYI